jgi:glycosyltransferase involved in cell wall biosynthesis
MSDKLIIEKSLDISELDSNFNFNGFRIVSIGRIDPVKRFSLIPEIVNNLKKRKLNFRWFIIGEGKGKEKELLIDNIFKYSVQNELLLLGEKNNPYPYIKQSDLLVSTSKSEACPNVINEAKILGTPIVAADFGSVYEFIEDNVNGLISPIETIADKIEQMITNDTLYNRIKNNISHFKYDNEEILNVLYNDIIVS